ncbi:MAG: siphovirus Gp157 family protein [Cyanobacteria bacterium J06621_8]
MFINVQELESGAELEQLSQLLEMTGENYTDLQSEEVEQQVTQIILRRENESSKEYNARLDRFLFYIQFLGNTSVIEDEIRRLQALQKSRKGLAERLKSMILYRLQVNRIDKIETPKHTLKVLDKGGRLPLELDWDEKEDLDKFPPEFVKAKTTQSVDKTKIIKHLEAGGTLTWARLLERGKRLSIK